MAIDTSTHNPFQPPESAAEFEGLAPDTEFLISDKCILCDDKIVLPAVCIESGKKTDLEKQSATLKWGPPRLTMLFVVMLIVVCPIVGNGALMARGANRGLAPPIESWESTIWTVAAFSVFALTAFLWWVVFRMKKQIAITWFVQQKLLFEQQKRVTKWRMWGVGSIGVGSVLILLGIYVNEAFAMIALPPIFAGLFCLSLSRNKIGPVFSGRHEGLNILTGLSPLFLKEVQEIIDRHYNEK